MGGERDRLSRELPIPPGWSEPEVVDDSVDLGGVIVHRAGVASRNESGVEMTGSAAERDGSPLRRAWLELLERMAISDRGPGASEDPRSRPSRSNGVAVHFTWERACASARLELIERDCVLRSWYGQIALEPSPLPEGLVDLGTHRWAARVLRDRFYWGPGVQVGVVVGFPVDPGLPLARGFAARSTGPAAIEAAAREAVQGLAFLWDEPLPDTPPVRAPTPIFHLEHYLYPGHHDALQRWLAGGHACYSDAVAKARVPASVSFVDLTTPSLNGRLRVARALCEGAFPLVFGEPPPELAARLPSELHVHPIS